jgi:hypothetical protein
VMMRTPRPASGSSGTISAARAKAFAYVSLPRK